MDVIIEFVVELLFEILGAVIESDKVPKWIRYFLLGAILSGLVTLLGFAIADAPAGAWKLLLLILLLGLVMLFVFLVYNIHRSGVLQQAKKEDLRQILKMYRSVIGKPGCSWSVSYPNEVNLYEDFSTGNLYVLRKGKKMIGAGSIVPKNELDDLDCWTHRQNAREIARLVIAPEYQSKGYGKHLVRKLCHRLEKMGCQAVHLLASVDNHHALNLYRETGFRNVGQCRRYDHDYYAYERKL